MRAMLIAAFVLASVRLSSALESYVFTDLGSLGGSNTLANGISASGRIVGSSELQGDVAQHAFVYDSGGMHDLGTLGGPNSTAYAINDAAGIVGQSDLLIGSLPHVFVTVGGRMTDLGIVPDGRPLAINAAGHIVGSFCVDAQCTTYSHAFLYDGTMHDLGTLGCPWSHAFGINDGDEVVGESCVPYASSYVQHAFLYKSGVMTDLNDFAPPNLVGLAQTAYAANDSGVVVGSASFLYTPGSPLAGPFNFGTPLAVNNRGQVVGGQPPGGGGNSAFLYSGGIVTALATFLPAGSPLQLASAMGINDSGQITGTGYDANGYAHGFLLSSTGPPGGGSSCSTLAACREALTGALPGVDAGGSKKTQRAARLLQKLNSAADHALDQGAASVGKKRHRWYAKAQAALTRLLRVARAASDRGTLGVPLAPIEAAVAGLRALLAA